MCPMSAILYSTTVGVGVGVGVEGCGGWREEGRGKRHIRVPVSMLPHVPGASGYIDNSFNLKLSCMERQHELQNEVTYQEAVLP